MLEFTLAKGDYIELIQLLKAVKLVYSGGEAKILVENEEVKLNGITELRKRAKVRKGDIVEALNQTIKIV